jgi:hypothetical protein
MKSGHFKPVYRGHFIWLLTYHHRRPATHFVIARSGRLVDLRDQTDFLADPGRDAEMIDTFRFKILFNIHVPS